MFLVRSVLFLDVLFDEDQIIDKSSETMVMETVVFKLKTSFTLRNFKMCYF